MANEPSTIDDILGGDLPDEGGVPVNAGAPGSGRPTPGDILSTAGGVVGAQLGGPVPQARAVGAAVLGGTGKFVGDVMQDFGGETGMNFRSGHVPTTNELADHLVDAVANGSMQGGAELLLPFGGAVAASRAALLPKKVGPMIEKTEAIVKKGGGPGLTAGQMIEDANVKSGVKIMENMSYNAFTSQVVNDTRMLNEQAVQNYGKMWVSQLEKLPASDVGDVLTAIVKERTERFVNKPLDIVFDTLRTNVPGRHVNVVPTIKLLRDPNSKIGNLVVGGLQKVRESSQNPQEIDTLISMLQTPEKGTQTQAISNLSLEQSFRLKTELGRIGNKNVTPATSLEDQSLIANAGRLAGEMDKSIKTSLKNAPDMLNLYEKANTYATKMYGVFRDDLLKATVHELEKRPGRVASVLLKPDNQDTIQAVRQAVGPRWKTDIEPILAASIVREGYDVVQNRFVGKQIAGALNRLGSDTIDATLQPGTYNKLLDFAKALEHVSTPPKGIGGMYIQMASAGAVGGVAGAGYAVVTGDAAGGVTKGLEAASLVLIAPWVMGHLVANPTLLTAMKDGLLQSQKAGKPTDLLLTTLKQAAAVAVTPTVQNVLTSEAVKSGMRQAAKLTPQIIPRQQARQDLKAE